MKYPQPGDFINIHTHGDTRVTGIFAVENLMAHEGVLPSVHSDEACTIGIHPWFLSEDNYNQLIAFVKDNADNPAVAAIGEAGFDKIKGPPMELQVKTFEEQVIISEEHQKPLIIHCVRAWDELLAAHKKLKPSTPWLIHGFHGKKEVASQLLSRGMYISVWYSFALIPESAELIRFIPGDRLFLETDGADVDIRDIYNKVSADLNIEVEELKSIIFSNYFTFFNINPLTTDDTEFHGFNPC